MPVDLYVGGAEHAVLHLLYARFWHKVLYDLGLVSTKEPFQRLVNQGMILGISYQDSEGRLIPADEVAMDGDTPYHRDTREPLTETPAKMSKSLKNVINPDDIIVRYGADSFRLYEMFMGPLESVKPWRTEGVDGVHRFLTRSWKMIIGTDGELAEEITDAPMSRDQLRVLHQTIKKVTEDINSLDFNTAISQLMVFVNEFGKAEQRNREAMETFVLLLSPFAPHIGEELWHRLGHTDSLAWEQWPVYCEEYLKEEQVEIALQVNGKPRTRVTVPADADQEHLKEIAQGNDRIQELTAGKEIKKIVAVPGKLVNVVAK